MKHEHVGRLVKVGTRSLKNSLGIDRTIRGGEGVVVDVFFDSRRRVLYTVRLTGRKKDRMRTVERTNLTLHTGPSVKKRKRKQEKKR